MKVELIYDRDCPFVAQMRTQLLKAFSKAKHPAKWTEWDRNSPDSPDHAKRYGSPTLLIDGQDIANEKPTNQNCCRLYPDESNQLQAIPALSTVVNKLKAASKNSKNTKRFSWHQSLSATPGIMVALLPKLTCPFCWPLYTGLLSSMGISFINYTPLLLPLMIIFLLIALFSLAYKAKNRRGYNPLFLGILASVFIVVGKFAFDNETTLYVGVTILVAASIWNAWPLQNKAQCNTC